MMFSFVRVDSTLRRCRTRGEGVAVTLES